MDGALAQDVPGADGDRKWPCAPKHHRNIAVDRELMGFVVMGSQVPGRLVVCGGSLDGGIRVRGSSPRRAPGWPGGGRGGDWSSSRLPGCPKTGGKAWQGRW